MAFTRAWGTTYKTFPANTDLASEGAARIRDFKQDVEERMFRDHEQGLSTTGIAGHKQISITKDWTGAAPAPIPGDIGHIFARGDKLYWKPADGDSILLSGGNGDDSGGGTSGMVQKKEVFSIVAGGTPVDITEDDTGLNPSGVGFTVSDLSEYQYLQVFLREGPITGTMAAAEFTATIPVPIVALPISYSHDSCLRSYGGLASDLCVFIWKPSMTRIWLAYPRYPGSSRELSIEVISIVAEKVNA